MLDQSKPGPMISFIWQTTCRLFFVNNTLNWMEGVVTFITLFKLYYNLNKMIKGNNQLTRKNVFNCLWISFVDIFIIFRLEYGILNSSILLFRSSRNGTSTIVVPSTAWRGMQRIPSWLPVWLLQYIYIYLGKFIHV